MSFQLVANAPISSQILYLPFTVFSLDVSYFHWTFVPVLVSCNSVELSQINSALLQIQHKWCTSLSPYLLYMFLLHVSLTETHVSMSWLLSKLTWDGFPKRVTIKQTFITKVILVTKWLLLPPSWSTKHHSTNIPIKQEFQCLRIGTLITAEVVWLPISIFFSVQASSEIQDSHFFSSSTTAV